MLGAWRSVVLVAAIAGAVLTPSTDPVTELLAARRRDHASVLIGVGLVGHGRGALRPELPDLAGLELASSTARNSRLRPPGAWLQRQAHPPLPSLGLSRVV